MKNRLISGAAMVTIAAFVGVGCAKPSETQTTTTKIENPTGTTETKEEVKRDASGTEASVKTTTDPAGLGNSSTYKAQTYIGTVTEYKAGKKIEVETMDKEKHTVDLDGHDLVVSIDPGVQVGSRVKLVEEKDSDSKVKRISVSMGG